MRTRVSSKILSVLTAAALVFSSGGVAWAQGPALHAVRAVLNGFGEGPSFHHRAGNWHEYFCHHI